MKYIKEIFAYTFLLSRKWELIFNREAGKDDLTLKQMMLMIVLKNTFESDPTIKEIASTLATSHQNVKAIVKQLEKKSFVSLYTDVKDKRITRVQVKVGKESYWQKRGAKDEHSMQALFAGIDEEKLRVTLEVIEQLNRNVESINT